MAQQKTLKLKYLLDKVPPGFIVDTAWLKGHGGLDRRSIHEYVERGWLEHVIRGVYRRPIPEHAGQPPETDWLVPLLSLQWIMNVDIHLGGESALDLAGYVHYVSFGNAPEIHIYGNAPSWLKRLPTNTQFVEHSLGLFGGDTIGIAEGMQTMEPGVSVAGLWRWPIKASSPERAILEAIDGLPKEAGFDRLDKIFESLVSLRPTLLTDLLCACRSVKVKRLFFVFADRHGHAWRKYIDMSKIDFGSGPRRLFKGGKIHPTYRISIPQEFMTASGTDNAYG